MADPTPTTIAALETGARQRLTERMDPKFSVEAFPDDYTKYRLLNQSGAFLVGYSGATYGPSASTDIIAQARRMQLAVTIQCRQLSGHDGVYDMLERARVALHGCKLPGFDQMTCVSEKFIGQNQGVNVCLLVLATATLAVACEGDSGDPPIPTLQRLTVQPAPGAIGHTFEVTDA